MLCVARPMKNWKQDGRFDAIDLPNACETHCCHKSKTSSSLGIILDQFVFEDILDFCHPALLVVMHDDSK